MNFFLLSDTENPSPVLEERLRDEISKRGNKVAYISSQPQDEQRKYFMRTAGEYRAINSDISLEYFDLSDAYSDAVLKNVISDFDVVHLSGGNTFSFLASLRKRKIESLLRSYLQSDKLIIGVSAGAIILTPTIGTASVGDGDINEVGIEDLRGFDFVDFEFLPHFYNTEEDCNLAKEYSAGLSKILYACSDSDGIFVNSGKMELLGTIHKFFNKIHE